MASALRLSEANNEVCRIEEELELLQREMHAHLTYYEQHLIPMLHQLELELRGDIGADAYVMLPGPGRYQPSAQQLRDDPLARSGALSYVRAAQFEAAFNLGVAREHFARIGLSSTSGGGSGVAGSSGVGGSSGGGRGAYGGVLDDGPDSEDGDRVPLDGYDD